MKNKKFKSLLLLSALSFLFLAPGSANAHPGQLAKDGCHWDRKAGVRHCHAAAREEIRNKTEESPSTAEVGGRLFMDEAIRQTPDSRVLKVDYPGFTIWLDCQRHGAVKFQYVPQRDLGNARRNNQFYLDPNVPKECQQASARGYGRQFDRGHLVPQNHLDQSDESARSSNTMVNILPQAATLNRNAWFVTENIIECRRDTEELLVIGGVIWGNNEADDYFVGSHNIQTPDAFWKVIVSGPSGNEKAIAWIMPNSSEATKENIDNYLVNIDEIELVTGERIPVPDQLKANKPAHSWEVSDSCDRS